MDEPTSLLFQVSEAFASPSAYMCKTKTSPAGTMKGVKKGFWYIFRFTRQPRGKSRGMHHPLLRFNRVLLAVQRSHYIVDMNDA